MDTINSPTTSLLYVDDCTELREAIGDLLSESGRAVTCCASAEQASSLLAQHDYDVLLLDVRLPGSVDGVELARRTLASRPHQRVILCSGSNVDLDVARLGPTVRLLTKPFQVEDLEALLDEQRHGSAAPNAGGARSASVAETRILVVDDLRDAAESLAATLAAEGYRTRTAGTTRDALVALGLFQPHAVLLKGSMPGAEAAELARVIRQQQDGGVVLIAHSRPGSGEPGVLDTLRYADHHLAEPLEMRALKRVLADAASAR